jgi:colanic acid/amylovoran biosynthesis protein
MKTHTVGIIGGTISGNRGAEAMLVTVVGKIREKFPDAEIKVFSYYPSQDRGLVNQPYVDILSCKPVSLVFRFLPFAFLEWLFKRMGVRLPDRFLTRVIRVLRTCDVLVDISGVSFVGGREIFLPFNILTIWPAMLLGVPVVKLAQALGPFKSSINRFAAKLFLPRCNRIFARGNITDSYLRALDLENVSRAADVAFLYRNEYSLTVENEGKNDRLEEQLLALKAAGSKVIAIAPSSLVHQNSLKVGKDYVQSILDLAEHFQQDDVHFLFIPNSNRETSEKSRNNDLFVLRLLYDRALTTLPEHSCQRMNWVLWDVNTSALRRLVSHCDLLMTSRFHAMIAGLSLGVPTLVIGWSHKYVETLADFGLEKYTADFGDAKVDLARLAEGMLREQSHIRKEIMANLPRVQELSNNQFSYLENFFSRTS